jgi:hypothetical protein
VVGPFLADGKNNVASIAKNIFMNNEEGILDWLEDDGIVVLDRGFRDALTTINNFGFRVQMPDFLNGKKQLSAREANNSRCVTKVRWIIEGGMNETNLTLVSMFHLFCLYCQSMPRSSSGDISPKQSKIPTFLV